MKSPLKKISLAFNSGRPKYPARLKPFLAATHLKGRQRDDESYHRALILPISPLLGNRYRAIFALYLAGNCAIYFILFLILIRGAA